MAPLACWMSDMSCQTCLFLNSKCRKEGYPCSRDNKVKRTQCNRTVGCSPSLPPAPLSLLCPSSLFGSLFFLSLLASTEDSSKSSHWVSFICVLSQCLSFVEGGACCQVLSLYEAAQAQYGPQALKQARLIISPLFKSVPVSHYGRM